MSIQALISDAHKLAGSPFRDSSIWNMQTSLKQVNGSVRCHPLWILTLEHFASSNSRSRHNYRCPVSKVSESDESNIAGTPPRSQSSLQSSLRTTRRGLGLISASILCLAPEFQFPAAAHSAIFEDPGERAVIATLNAREELHLLSTHPATTWTELLKWRRALDVAYESLSVYLPQLVEMFGVDEEDVGEILWNLAYAKGNVGLKQRPLSSSPGGDLTPSSRTEQSLALMQLSVKQVDYLCNEVPDVFLEAAQLARGIRPMA